jgi:serine protease Do
MKLSTRGLTVVLGFAALAGPSFAADNENKKDLRVIVGKADEHQAKESVTYLGIETVAVTRTLTEQLGLEPDMGLVVNSVADGSPAAAVLKPHDILLKLDDQKVIDAHQVSVLIRAHKDGDEVTLVFVRAGKEATAKVKLVRREQPSSSNLRWKYLPGEEGLRQLVLPPGESPQSMELERILPLMKMSREMQAQVIHPRVDGEPGDLTVVNTDNSNLVLADEHGTLEIKLKEGKKEIVDKNGQGEVVFSGPFNSEEERKAAPPDVRTRIEQLKNMEGFSFKLDGDFHPGDSDVVVPARRRIQFRIPEAFPFTRRALSPSFPDTL